MQEMKDPAIKLFGMTIPVIAEAEGPEISGENSAGVSGSGSGVEDMNFSSSDTPSSTESYEKEEDKMKARTVPEKAEKDPLSRNLSETKQQDDAPKPMETDSRNQETCSETNENDNPKTPSIDEETATTKASKTEKEQSEMTSAQEKPLKKPDKIVPCPRCNSMDTKFCYYNNYNVNQPRHFCKSCQRYWTNGGTMRNVPVGAGRRKNKNSVSQYRHITVSEALQAATRIDAPNGVRYPASSLKGDGTVLNFCSDATLSESMASVLNLTEKALWNGKCNGFHKIEEHRKPSVLEISQNGDDHSCASSLTASNSEEGNRGSAQEPLMPNFDSFPPQISCLPGVPWPYQWNSVVPPPPFYPPGFPPSFYHPAGYWNCAIPGTWNIPWMAALPDQKAPISGPNSPTLGKHSRDGNVLETEREQLPKQKTTLERSIWVPKTLRIDDPEEAAKSSIWATLGIKNDSIRGRGLFKAFQSKGNEKDSLAETSPVLCANPAALSRSLNFHESF